MEEIAFYNALLEDIKIYRERIQCLTDDEGNVLCDELLQNIEDAYKQDYISDEQVRYLTEKILRDI